jgi:hypothetical protein
MRIAAHSTCYLLRTIPRALGNVSFENLRFVFFLTQFGCLRSLRRIRTGFSAQFHFGLPKIWLQTNSKRLKRLTTIFYPVNAVTLGLGLTFRRLMPP